MNSDDQNASMRGPNYNWEIEAKHLSKEVDKLRSLLDKIDRSCDLAYSLRDGALDALTISQEEWLLKTKNLEIKNYNLEVKYYNISEALELAKQTMHFTYYAIQNQMKLSTHTVPSLVKSKDLLDKAFIDIEEFKK